MLLGYKVRQLMEGISGERPLSRGCSSSGTKHGGGGILLGSGNRRLARHSVSLLGLSR